MKQSGAIVLIMLTFALSVQGQPRSMMRGESGEPPFFFFEPVNLIADDSSLSRLDILYRIDQMFFVAVKNRDTSSPLSFVSRGEVLIELFDSLDVSKARSIQKVERGTQPSDREPPGKHWYAGMASFDLSPGRYKIVFEVDDLESERRYVDDKSTIHLKKFGPSSCETSTPVFLGWEDTRAAVHSLAPIGFGPHLLFGRKAAVYVELPSARSTVEGVRAAYTISKTSLMDHSSTVALAETLTNLSVFPKVRLDLSEGGNDIAYTVSSDTRSRGLGIIIPLASEKLPLRPFELALTITVATEEFRVTKNFQMVWPDMPSSLRDIDYAINALKYISTEQQRDSLRRGDLEERRDNLEAFWKAKSNTPAHAYNEVMVEYYRRVDHASKTFGTLRNPDGFMSDRGRIYVLYGPPTKTDRTLSPTVGYQEVWLYEKSGKKFIFADQTKSGNYVLISTEQL